MITFRAMKAPEIERIAEIDRYEMRYPLELCGFDVLAEHSDFKGSPPAYGKEQVWVAAKGATP